jgi:hypothetical protein
VRKIWQIWFIFSPQDVLERKKYKNGKKNSMKLVRLFGPKSVIFKHIHFSFGKTHQKKVKFCTIGAYDCVFKRNFLKFENTNFR